MQADSPRSRPRSPARLASESALRRAVLSLLIAGLVCALFSPALEAEFLNFDDDRNLVDNRHVRGLDAQHLGWMFTTSWMGPYQPLAWVSLALDHQLFGLDPGAFHRTSVLLHALGALAVFGLARKLLACARPAAAPGARDLAAAATALFFALHPLRVESVVWVTERRDVLAGLFSVLAARAWLGFSRAARPRPSARDALVGALGSALAVAAFFASVDRSRATRLELVGPGWLGLALGFLGLLVAARALGRGAPGGPRRHALVLLLLLCALLSKGTSVVLPAVLCVLDVYPLRRRASLALVLEKLPLFALALVFSVLAVWGQGRGADAIATLSEHGPFERALQSLYGLAYYPWRTLVPAGLSPLYELPARIAPTPRFLWAALAVLAAAGAAWLLRRRAPAPGAALLAFALAIAPVLGLLQVGPQLVADRYSYTACLPFALLFGGALLPLGRAAVPVAALWLAALSAGTWSYAAHWRTSEQLWARAVAVDPESPTALYGLATTGARLAEQEADPAQRRAGFERADLLLERALEHGDDPRIPAGLARVRAQRALLEPDQRERLLADAARLSQRAFEQASADGQLLPTYRLALGLDLLAVARPAEAAPHLEAYTALAPEDPRGWQALAEAHEALARPARAAAAWRRVLELAPTHARARRRIEVLGGGGE